MRVSPLEDNFSNKAAILDAITRLSKNTEFDDIPISTICSEAGISKTTFYRVFSSKYDVVEWLMTIYSAAGLDQIGRTKNWHDAISYSVYNLASHRSFLLSANKTKHPMETPAEIAYRHRRATLEETVTEWMHAELTMRLRYQIDEWSYYSTHIAQAWYRKELDCRKEEYINLLESLVPSELFLLLNEPAKADPEKNDGDDPGIKQLALRMLQSLGN